jgi:hypothetical protein
MASIARLPSGKFRVQVRVAGQYRGRSFATKREAQDWANSTEAHLKQRVAQGVVQPGVGLKLSDAIDVYLAAVGLKPANQDSLRAFGRTVGDIALRDLNSATLQRWIDHRLQVDGVQGQTVAHNLGLVSSLLKWLRYSRNIDVDLALSKHARASLSAARVQTTSQERDRYVSDAEIELMREAFSTQKKLKLPMADLMDFALATGVAP